MLTHLNETNVNPRRVIILGAGGFIGRSLNESLKKEKIETVLLTSKDLDLTADHASSELEKIMHFDDSLVFLSALTPDKGKGLEAFEKNMKMVLSVAKALSNKAVAHVLYASSDAIYSMEESIVNETTLPNPEDLYGLMHFTRECILRNTVKSLAVIRPTLVFGLEDTHNSYGPNRLRRMAQTDKKITLFGGGEEKRDHIFIDDLVALLVRVLKRRSVGDLNAVTGRSVSYMELAKEISKLHEHLIEIITTERKNPITYRHFDNAAVYKAFPDFSFTSLEEGLARTHAQMLRSAA